jgi:hypothetical protein
MATSKKKSVNVPSGSWPKINQGTHLTVKTFEDGRTELIWDWDALVKEVREACTSVETKPKTKTKKSVNKLKV